MVRLLLRADEFYKQIENATIESRQPKGVTVKPRSLK